MTPYTREELAEALHALASMQHKSEATLISMQQKNGRAAQLTLLRRRVRALALAQQLVRQQLAQSGAMALCQQDAVDPNMDPP